MLGCVRLCLSNKNKTKTPISQQLSTQSLFHCHCTGPTWPFRVYCSAGSLSDAGWCTTHLNTHFHSHWDREKDGNMQIAPWIFKCLLRSDTHLNIHISPANASHIAMGHLKEMFVNSPNDYHNFRQTFTQKSINLSFSLSTLPLSLTPSTIHVCVYVCVCNFVFQYSNKKKKVIFKFSTNVSIHSTINSIFSLLEWRRKESFLTQVCIS